MTAARVVFRHRRATASKALCLSRDRVMEQVAEIVRKSADPLQTADDVIRYATVCRTHHSSPEGAGAFLASLAGQVIAAAQKGSV